MTPETLKQAADLVEHLQLLTAMRDRVNNRQLSLSTEEGDIEEFLDAEALDRITIVIETELQRLRETVASELRKMGVDVSA